MKISLRFLCIFLFWISDSRGQIRSSVLRSGQLFRNFYTISNTFSSANIRRNVPNIRFAVGGLTRQVFTARQRPIIFRPITQPTLAAVSPSVNVASLTARQRMFTQPIRVVPYSTGSYYVTSAPRLVSHGQLSPVLNIPSVPFVTSQTPAIFGLSIAQNAPSFFQFPAAPVNVPFFSPPSVVPGLPVSPVNVLMMPSGQLQPNVQQNGTSGTGLSPVDTQSSRETSQSLVQDLPNRIDDIGGDNLMRPDNSWRQSNSRPNVNTILGNILNKIRRNRVRASITDSSQHSRENIFNRRRNNILRQGDRLFRPLYKGHFRGERIVLARSIGTADRLHGINTTGIHSFSRSDIAGRLVGESKLDYARRISAKTRLPLTDPVNEEDGFLGLSERTSASRNMPDRSTEISRGDGVPHSNEVFPDDVSSHRVDERFGETSSSQNSQETNSQIHKFSKFFPTEFDANSQHDRSQVIRIDQPGGHSDPSTDTAFDANSNLQIEAEPSALSPDIHVAFPGEIAQTNPSNAGDTASETDVIISPVDRSLDIVHEQTAETNTRHEETESPVADIVSNTHHFVETDGFLPRDTSDVQHEGRPDIFLQPFETNSHEMSAGLGVGNTVEEPGLLDTAVNQESIITNDVGVPEKLAASATNPGITVATMVHLPDVMGNSPPPLQAFNKEMGIRDAEPAADIGMTTIPHEPTNTFNNAGGVMQDSQVDLFGFDSSRTMKARDQGSHRRNKLETTRSANDNIQTSRFVSETSGVDSLTCPTRRPNHGVCKDDFDCQRGYCYHRAAKHGICCE